MNEVFIFKWRRILFTALLTLVVAWIALLARQWLFRIRAERLLADIKTLELNRSSWADAQKLMTRWGEWGHWYGSCNSDDCSYTILIGHLQFVYPTFEFEEGPHLLTRILELGGLRSAAVSARFHIVHGLVTNTGFGMSVTLPVSIWITPNSSFWLRDKNGSAYWPTLDVAFREGAKLDVSSPYAIAKHPDHGFIRRRITLEAHFTPEETLQERMTLTNFHFDCITRWTACHSWREILPAAEEEDEADTQAITDPSLSSICFPTVQLRAREEHDVLVGDVVQSEAAPTRTSDGNQHRYNWLVRMRLRTVLKGKAPVSPGNIFLIVADCDDEGENCSRPLPGSQFVLTGMNAARKLNPDDPDFFTANCGLIEATQENLAAAWQGVQQDFGPIN